VEVEIGNAIGHASGNCGGDEASYLSGTFTKVKTRRPRLVLRWVTAWENESNQTKPSKRNEIDLIVMPIMTTLIYGIAEL